MHSHIKARDVRAKLAPKRIGLLGGSFNPPHQGHLQLSQQALKRLGLDEVWWLVSPQNPMKSSEDTRDYDERLALCDDLCANDPRLFVCDIENMTGLRLSADTVGLLQKLYPHSHFVWLAGSDIMNELHLWEEVGAFLSSLPIAFFARPRSVITGLNAVFAKRMHDYRYYGAARDLIYQNAPAWQFFMIPMNPLSSTQLRAQERATLSALQSQPKAARSDEEACAQLLSLVQNEIEDLKAKDVRLFDLRRQAAFADFMVLCTGNANTHVKSIARKVMDKAKQAGFSPINVSGESMGDWILIDFGDIVVHIFREEVRAYYQLEKLWDPTQFD